MRKIVIAIVAVIVVLLLAVLLIPQFIDVNQYRGQIQSELQNRIGRPVQLGEMSLHSFPLRVEVKNVVIGDDPGFHGPAPFAQANEVDISVKLLPLLSKNIELNSLQMVRPKIELIRNAQGAWNFASLGNAPSVPASQATPKAQPPAKQAQKPSRAGLPSTISRLRTARLLLRTTRSISRARCTTTLICR